MILSLLGFHLNKTSNEVSYSSIFLWFAADFAQYGGIEKFVLPYVSAADAQYIETHSNSLSKQFLKYNWKVNGAPPCNCTTKKQLYF